MALGILGGEFFQLPAETLRFSFLTPDVKTYPENSNTLNSPQCSLGLALQLWLRSSSLARMESLASMMCGVRNMNQS